MEQESGTRACSVNLASKEGEDWLNERTFSEEGGGRVDVFSWFLFRYEIQVHTLRDARFNTRSENILKWETFSFFNGI
jgi:hypothetical protein